MPTKMQFHPDAPGGVDFDWTSPEGRVRAITCTSVEDAKGRIKKEEDLAIITEAHRRETASPAGKKTLIKLLSARLRKITPTDVITADEGLDLDWTSARHDLETVKLHGKLFLLSQIVLGWRLQDIKKTLGFDQRGGDRAKSHRGTLPDTWEDHLSTELGIKKTTAYRFEQCFLGAKAKLKRLGTHTRALELLETSPDDLDPEDLKTLTGIIADATDGLTQKALLHELHLIKAPQGSGAKGGDTTTNDPPPAEPSLQQLSFKLFGHAQAETLNLRDHTDYQLGLAALPLTSEDEDTPSLASLETTYTGILADIQTAKEKAKANLAKNLTA